MHLIILGLLLTVIILLIVLLRTGNKNDDSGNTDSQSSKKKQKNPGMKNEPPKPSFCLICGEELGKGCPMRTTIYPEDGNDGRLLEIHGCDACIPPEGTRTRKCPVCGAKLKTGEFLIARRYDTPGKKQVTISGCSRCFHS